VFAGALHETILYLSLKIEEKFLKYKENVFVWIRAPAATLPAESANCMQSRASCNTAGTT
jgi:hypothetical protein